MVPGDIVRLSAGDLVPADARLLTARDLYVLQASLTGESLPADKEATGEPASTKADARNMVFLGTSVVSGTATAEVVATGARTAFGDIASRLSARPEETAFDLGLEKFQPTPRANGFLSRSFPACRQHCAPPRSASVAAVCSCPSSRPDA